MSLKYTRPEDALNIEIPFDHPELTVCIGAASSLLRTKIRQALESHEVQIFETEDVAQLAQFITSFSTSVVFLGFRFFGRDEFPGLLGDIPKIQMPKLVLTGTQQELDSDIGSKGVDALLCLPFLPEMLLHKINHVLKPNTNWSQQQEQLLRKMRKYQRFQVSNVTANLHKPIKERTRLLDFSYQGIKVVTEAISPEKIGEVFQMQISCEGAYILIEAKLMWVREDTAGFRFSRERPHNFMAFFRQIIAIATDVQ